MNANHLLTGCPQCDEHGPDLPGQTMVAAARDTHRALHDIARALGLRRLQQFVAWLSRRLEARP